MIGVWRGAMLAMVVSAWHVGCDRGKSGPPPALPPVEVTYVTIEPRTVPAEYTFIGQTEASQQVEIRARIQGFLKDWRGNFEEGGAVAKNQVLFEIDPTEFLVAVEEAKSSVARAEAREQRANREVGRLEEAAKAGAATPKELDDAVTEQLQAKADVRLQKATLAARDVDLSYTTIRSPIDGVIGRAQRDVGSLVDANQNSLLATVSQLDPMYVNFTFSERDYIEWRKDVEAGRVVMPQGGPNNLYIDISLIEGTAYPYWGVVNFADVRINSQTGTASVRATIANPLLPTPRKAENLLKPGQFVKGRIVGWLRPNTITVPQRAVVQSAAGAYVYVIGADNKPEVRPVQTGAWIGNEWTIANGLSAGERVVVDGVAKVAPNIPVKPAALPPTTRPAATTKPTTAPTTLPAAEANRMDLPSTMPTRR